MKARLLGPLLTAALALAGCGGAAAPASTPVSASSAAGAGGSAAGAAKPSTAAAASGGAAAKPSAGGAASAAGNGPIKIGILLPLTGGSADSGLPNKDGFDFFMSTINSTVAGRKIEVTYADTQNKPDLSLTKAKQLVEDQHVNMLMGGISTPECYALANYVKEVQVPFMISGNCGAETLMTDPKFKSPYLSRFTLNTTGYIDPGADWAAKKGFKKAIVMTSDFGGGLEYSDAFGSAYVNRGGTVIQELHPALGTSDFGPVLAQLDQNADLLVVFLAGADGVRFGKQYATYQGKNKPQVLDLGGLVTNMPNLSQIGDTAVGMVAVYVYSTGLDTPMNQAFLKAYRDKNPGKAISTEVGNGYASAQVLEAALKKVNGAIEDKQAFLNALDSTNMETVKGPLKLDADHDIIENIYVYQTVKDGSGYGQKVLQTYSDVSRNWDRSAQEVGSFPFGKLKGKWVGMTKEKLQAT